MAYYVAAIMSSMHGFGELLPYQSPRELDELQKEFTVHQLLHEEEAPKEIWDEAMVVKNTITE